MLQLAEILSFKEILRIKDEFKITNPHLPVMKGIHNTKGNPICLTFLLGGHCDSTDPCGYHLQVNYPNRLPRTSNANYETLHDCLVAIK